jgi:mono/diheme cytochrome c family protein
MNCAHSVSRARTEAWTAVVTLAIVLFAQGAGAQTRGQLLYDAHCIACHRVQVHWRDQRIARDWDGLRKQVRHWQAAASLDWNDRDIDEVARHLNAHYYQFAEQRAQRTERVDTR